MSIDGKLRISEVKATLSDLLLVPQIGVPFVKGQPGVGKSAIVVDLSFEMYEKYQHPKTCKGCKEQAGDPTKHERGCPAWHAHGTTYCDVCKLATQDKLDRPYAPHVRMKDIRLTHFDPIEIKGLSGGVEVDGKNVTTVFVPDWLPTDPEEYSILFLDEFTLAPKPVQDAALQIVHDRRVHNAAISKHCAIICAGNGENDGANIVRLSGPLNNRLLHLEVDLSLDDFLNYGRRKNIRPEILGACEHYPEHMFPEFDRDKVAQPTPRTLEVLSKLIDRAGKDDEATFRKLGVPTIGNAATTTLVAFVGLYEKVKPEEIVLEGKMPTFKSDEIDRQFASACAVAHFLRKSDVKKVTTKKATKNVFDFLDTLTVDLQVRFMNDIDLAANIDLTASFLENEAERFQTLNERLAGAVMEHD